MSKPAQLSSGLIVTKGSAAPALVSVPPVARVQPPAEKEEGVTVASKIEPKKQKPTTVESLKPAPEVSGGAYYKALTLKLDKDRFMKLKQHGLNSGQTSQAILTEALDLWLAANVLEE